MNTSELVKAVAEETGMPATAAKKAVDAVFGRIAGELAIGNEVSVTGFGKFAVRHRAAQNGRNPRTGEPVVIQASKSVGFKASSTLKGAL